MERSSPGSGDPGGQAATVCRPGRDLQEVLRDVTTLRPRATGHDSPPASPARESGCCTRRRRSALRPGAAPRQAACMRWRDRMDHSVRCDRLTTGEAGCGRGTACTSPAGLDPAETHGLLAQAFGADAACDLPQEPDYREESPTCVPLDGGLKAPSEGRTGQKLDECNAGQSTAYQGELK
jgi:hypothetical protein